MWKSKISENDRGNLGLIDVQKNEKIKKYICKNFEKQKSQIYDWVVKHARKIERNEKKEAQ